MELTIGTPLIHLMEYVDNRRMPEEYRERIIAYCKTELEIGDGVITNEIEIAILNAWLSGTDEVIMPNISDSFELISSKSYKERNNIKTIEEYKHQNGSYYVKTSIINSEGKIIKTQLAHRKKPLEEIIKHGGVEDVLMDMDGDNIANSRLIHKSEYNEFDTKESKIHFDVNLDGKLD